MVDRDIFASLTTPAPSFKVTRCAIYTRQSVARPGGDEALASCTLQRERCIEHIRSMAWRGWYPIGEPFDDEGESGATTERTAIERLLVRISEGSVQRVVVYRLDRLTRKLADWTRFAGFFDRYGVGLTVVSGALDTEGGTTARLQLNLLAIFAEVERELIRERLSDARAARRARGLRTAGRVPFGYASNRKTKQLEVFEPEARIVRWFFAEAASAKSTFELVTAANTRSYRTKTGDTWAPRTVLRLLQNQVYAGCLPAGSPSAHQAIVDGELFDRVRALIVQRRTGKPSKRPVSDKRHDRFVLRGLLSCGKCGHIMSPSMSQALTQKSAKLAPRYYRCRTPRCSTGQVAAMKVECMFVHSLNNPDGAWPEERRMRLLDIAAILSMMWPTNRQREIAKEFASIVWQGRSLRLTLNPTPLAAQSPVDPK